MALALVLAAVPAAAEWQIKPSLGVEFGGSTTFLELEPGVGGHKAALGISGLLIGEIFGVEGDFGYVPGYFTGDGSNVSGSHVSSLTGSVVIALPRHMTRYTLRPYFVGGGGLLHARANLYNNIEAISATLPAMDLGGGVTGFLSKRLGINWDARYIRSVGEGKIRGQSIAPEQLSFWRVSMGLAIRL